LAGETLEDVATVQMDPALHSTKGADVSWPDVSRDHEGVDYQALARAVDAAFKEDSAEVDDMKSTRAVLVYYDGALIAERYADGFNGNTPQRGMSMTKSVTSALVGVLVDQGKLNVDDATGLEYWHGKSDPRREITLDQMLKMTAGFDYNEQLEDKPRSLINYVFFNSADMSKRASEVGLRAVPGETWDYQTVHPILLQKIIRDAIGDDQAYFRFAQEELFARAGMMNSHLSADASGTFTGGALMWASARDWMRFGLLYLNDGLHNGTRVLPEGWVKYSSTPSNASLNGTAYGAQFWLNQPAKEQLMPGLPEDAYAAMGHYGQYVMIVPSKKLVVVRLGMTFPPKMFDRAGLLKDVLDSLEE
jgi:CubicO group peptidase (beta-lactamase class C family)